MISYNKIKYIFHPSLWNTVYVAPSVVNISTLGAIYIAYYTSKSGIWLVISRVASYFHEPKASANIAYE